MMLLVGKQWSKNAFSEFDNTGQAAVDHSDDAPGEKSLATDRADASESAGVLTALPLENTSPKEVPAAKKSWEDEAASLRSGASVTDATEVDGPTEAQSSDASNGTPVDGELAADEAAGAADGAQDVAFEGGPALDLQSGEASAARTMETTTLSIAEPAIELPGWGQLAVQFGLALTVVIGLILLLQKVARRYGGQWGRGRNPEEIRVLSQKSMGQRLSLAIVEVEEQRWLVSISPQGIQRVADLDFEEPTPAVIAAAEAVTAEETAQVERAPERTKPVSALREVLKRPWKKATPQVRAETQHANVRQTRGNLSANASGGLTPEELSRFERQLKDHLETSAESYSRVGSFEARS